MEQPPRRSQPTLLREYLGRVMQSRGIGRRSEHAAVFSAWREIVPPEVAARARPVSFRAGRLIVAVDSAPLMHELRCFRAGEFLALLNRRLAAGSGPQALVRQVDFRRA
ncbi:MAG: DUF721 domain-containing protein [Planctomycetota bacterium]|nr:MAG: DUF721 domain-containing protein [Planctomycetota bacterium]